MWRFIRTQFCRIKRFLSRFFVEREYTIISGEALICMIDIANYSAWCKRFRKRPEHIFRVMFEYNEHICAFLRRYDSLQKIELVGDSIVVIGMIGDTQTSQTAYIQMLAFVSDVLSHVPRMKVDFDEESISVRIGIHIGSIYGDYMRYPRRFQIFGNPVNVASRLQSKTENGSVLITDKSIHRALIERHYSDSNHSKDENSNHSKDTDNRRTSLDIVIDKTWHPIRTSDELFSPHEDDDERRSQELNKASKIKRKSIGCESLKGVGDYAVSRLYSLDLEPRSNSN